MMKNHDKIVNHDISKKKSWYYIFPLSPTPRRTLCENVDSAKIKVPFYTADIDILRCIVSIHVDESLHPY